MRIKSQLTSPKVAVDRNVDNSTVDAISQINNNMPELLKLTDDDVLLDISTLADYDFTKLTAQIDAISNLTVRVVETLSVGQLAEAELVGNELQLSLPRGYDGVTPQYEFTYNSGTGDLEYELTGYIDVNTGDIVSVTTLDELQSRIEEW